jgi:hypothetical protein
MVSRAHKESKRRSAKERVVTPVPPVRLFDTEKYGGRWVATRHGTVMAVGDSFSELDAEVRRLGIENEVVLTRVPRTGAVLL